MICGPFSARAYSVFNHPGETPNLSATPHLQYASIPSGSKTDEPHEQPPISAQSRLRLIKMPTAAKLPAHHSSSPAGIAAITAAGQRIRS